MFKSKNAKNDIPRPIHTDHAPKAIGPYSQAISCSASRQTIFLSGQIPLDPVTMELIQAEFKDQVKQVFANLDAVAKAAGGTLANIAKLTVLLIDMNDFPIINEVMTEIFTPPYPARATFAVAALPKGAKIEIEAIMSL